MQIATNIQWDTDGESVPSLPTSWNCPANVEAENVADYLSDTFGFCVLSLTLEEQPDGAAAADLAPAENRGSIMSAETYRITRREKMVVGLASIIDGIVILLTLGAVLSSLRQKASLRAAQRAARRSAGA